MCSNLDNWVPADYGSFELKAGDVSLKGSRSEVASGDAGVISKINFDLDLVNKLNVTV